MRFARGAILLESSLRLLSLEFDFLSRFDFDFRELLLFLELSGLFSLMSTSCFNCNGLRILPELFSSVMSSLVCDLPVASLVNVTTLYEFSYLVFNVLPTCRNVSSCRQHVRTVQEPEIPWHLHRVCTADFTT